MSLTVSSAASSSPSSFVGTTRAAADFRRQRRDVPLARDVGEPEFMPVGKSFGLTPHVLGIQLSVSACGPSPPLRAPGRDAEDGRSPGASAACGRPDLVDPARRNSLTSLRCRNTRPVTASARACSSSGSLSHSGSSNSPSLSLSSFRRSAPGDCGKILASPSSRSRTRERGPVTASPPLASAGRLRGIGWPSRARLATETGSVAGVVMAGSGAGEAKARVARRSEAAGTGAAAATGRARSRSARRTRWRGRAARRPRRRRPRSCRPRARPGGSRRAT